MGESTRIKRGFLFFFYLFSFSLLRTYERKK
nr:MAG TPA: hypothetical protein [Caudoviricetes sp.]